jgi:hypothetical protein
VLASGVRVAVHDEVGAGAIDRLGQEIASEERVDLEPLALQRLRDGRVVEHRDPIRRARRAGSSRAASARVNRTNAFIRLAGSRCTADESTAPSCRESHARRTP